MTTETFRVGRWIVEPSLNQITRGHDTIRLEPKVMRVLVCLASAHGAVVSRDQLVEEVWEGVHVVDAAVGRAIYQLRRALASADETQSYIETVRQVGYRLTVEVTLLKASRPPSRPFADEPPRLRDMAFVLCASVLVGGVALEQVAPVFQDLIAPAPVAAAASSPPAPVERIVDSRAQERAAAREALRQERMASRQASQAERRTARQALLEERMAANRALREELALDRRARRGLMLAGAGSGPHAPQAPPPPPAPAPPDAPPAPEPEPPGPA